jgi:mono/diheme cytochrome c family protein
LILALAGCSDEFNAGPMRYVESEKVATELKGKPDLQKLVRAGLADLFGADPQHIRVPDSTGLPDAGIRLANYKELGQGKVAPIKFKRILGAHSAIEPQEGGYALYRRHCLHCHGVSGAGDGPTSAFLYPRPRDYRKGLFKFTSTPTGAKPSRDDLRRTIRNGLHGSSMPAFEALMGDYELEQVIDYVIFLSMRGETELALVDEAASTGELSAETVRDVASSVFNKWKSAESQVVNPPVARTPSSPASIERGRDLFLSRNKTGNKVDCTSCHGPQAIGNGPSFVSQDVFNEVVFGGNPSEQAERLDQIAERVARDEEKKTGDPKAGANAAAKIREAWKNSLDDWGNPIRPNNLNRGIYRGGRRPIDIYWRIAKGINGVKMPAHYPTIEPEKIWDLVNFVLALPYDPSLLEGATLPETPPASAPKVANR